MSDEYTENAYQCAIVRELLRHLIDNFIPVANTEPKSQLICDEVPYKDRVVPIDSLVSMVSLLREREQWLRAEMGQFEMRRAQHVPLRKTSTESNPNKKTSNNSQNYQDRKSVV